MGERSPLVRLCRLGVGAAVCILLVWPACIAQTTADRTAPGNIRGLVRDGSGSIIVGAVVTLGFAGSVSPRTTITDQTGAFHFSTIEPGTYALTISALSFTDRKTTVSVVSGDNPPLPPLVLAVAPTISRVDVTLPPHEVAAAQVRAAEKQRVLGVFPNFYVSYVPNAAPLTAAQKFQLGLRTIIDPAVFLGSGIDAGIEQAHHGHPEFGQGVEGYSKRFGAHYAGTVTGVLIGHALTQTIFHQDPRYFYKGTGRFHERALYAIGTAFVRKGDNGHWQPDYSDVIGNLASGAISSLYYPNTSRPGLRLFHDVLLGFGDRAAAHLLQEFVYRSLTSHVPKIAAQPRPILREGTPVSLISIEDLRSGAPQVAKAITFVLAKDIEVDGVVAAQTGSKASGQATYAAVPSASAGPEQAIHLSLENVRLKIGDIEIPLRSTQQKRGTGMLDYHWLEDTGRIRIVLYLAANVSLPSVQ